MATQGRREWQVFVLPSIHQDISYQKSAEEDLQLFIDEYRKYLDLMDREPTWCYSSEFAYSVRHFLEMHPEEKDRLTRYVQAGRFGITAQCSGFDPSFYVGELVIREIAVAKKWLHDTFDYEPRTLHIADCPDFWPQLPQVLNACECDLFLCDRIGSGEGSRGNVLHIAEYPGMWERLDNEVMKITVWRMGYNQELGELDALYPGYWQWKREHKGDQPVSRLWYHVGLDGTRVLAYAPSQRYHGFCGLERAPGEKRESRLYNEEVFLSNLDPEVEPAYTALGIVGFDERSIRARQVVENVAAWNSTKRASRGVRLELSTAEPFSARMVELVESGQFTPGEYSGITPGWHFTGYDSDDMAFVQNQLPNAEMLATFNAMLGVERYPVEDFERAWEVLWAISHNQKSDASYFRTLRNSRRRAEVLLRRALRRFSTAIKPGRESPSILIFNPLNEQRSERVRVAINGAEVPGLVDSCGKPVPFTVAPASEGDSTQIEIEFIAGDVPGLGHRTFYLENGHQTDRRPKSDLIRGETWIQNRYFRIEMETEGYLHIEDLTRGRELVRAVPPFDTLSLAGQGLEQELPWSMKDIQTCADELKATLTVEGAIGDSPVALTLTLTTESQRVDLDVDLDWSGQPGVQLYLPLPFAFRPEDLRLGIACGHVPYYRPTAPAILRHAPLSRQSADITFSTYWYFPRSHKPIPGDDFSWAYMQKWAHLGASSGNVVVASGRRNGLVVGKGVLAIPLLATPPGRPRHVRRRGIYEKGMHHWSLAFGVVGSLEDAVRFGWRVAQPLLATSECHMGGSLDDAMSLIHLEPRAVIPMALKRSFNDDGWVARFFESTDNDIEVRLHTHAALGLRDAPAWTTNMLERLHEKVTVTEQGIFMPLRGFEIKTLLFEEHN